MSTGKILDLIKEKKVEWVDFRFVDLAGRAHHIMMPDPDSFFLDPFTDHVTLNIMCDIYTPDGERYDRDPRGIAQKAEQYLQHAGVATTAYFAPESEFFIFDEVRFETSENTSFYSVDSEEGHWNTGRREGGRKSGI